MFSVSDTISRIVALVGPASQRGRYAFNTIATAIAFLKLCRAAANHKALREVLAGARVSYASYWRLSHGCRSFGMALCIWPALREAMMQEGIWIRDLKAPVVYEPSGDAILERRTTVSVETAKHEPGSDGFREIVGELAPQIEIITQINGGHGPRKARSTTTIYNGNAKIQQGTPAFAKLVKRIVAGEFVD